MIRPRGLVHFRKCRGSGRADAGEVRHTPLAPKRRIARQRGYWSRGAKQYRAGERVRINEGFPLGKERRDLKEHEEGARTR